MHKRVAWLLHRHASNRTCAMCKQNAGVMAGSSTSSVISGWAPLSERQLGSWKHPSNTAADAAARWLSVAFQLSRPRKCAAVTVAGQTKFALHKSSSIGCVDHCTHLT
jgi:hypothetical protein